VTTGFRAQVVSNVVAVRPSPFSLCRDRFAHISTPAAICPDGALVTGKGSKFIVLGTDELLDQIETLKERLRALEQGLEGAWREGHDEVHPLLTQQSREITKKKAMSINDEERVAATSSVARGADEEEYEDLPEVLEAPPELSSTVKGSLNVDADSYNEAEDHSATARTDVGFYPPSTHPNSSHFSGWFQYVSSHLFRSPIPKPTGLRRLR
jgi:hypothetical protein